MLAEVSTAVSEVAASAAGRHDVVWFMAILVLLFSAYQFARLKLIEIPRQLREERIAETQKHFISSLEQVLSSTLEITTKTYDELESLASMHTNPDPDNPFETILLKRKMRGLYRVLEVACDEFQNKPGFEEFCTRVRNIIDDVRKSK